MERLVAGERRALTSLYDRYAPLLLGLGTRILKNQAEAEDVLHEVFMEAWHKAASYDPTRGTVRAWLTLRMRSRSIDRLRSAPRRREIATEDDPEVSAPRMVTPPPTAPRLRGELDRLRRGLLALAPERRLVVELVYFEALSLAEAAQELGCPIGTVKSRLFAARADLKSSLAEEGEP